MNVSCSDYILSRAWAEDARPLSRLNINSFELPYKLGEVKDSCIIPGSKKTIIQIQDAHCNYFAQHKIDEIIAYLTDRYGIDIINMEGGSGKYDLSIFTDISDPAIRRTVSNKFVRNGRISGAEFFAINSDAGVNLWGVEEPGLYIKNLLVYRDALRYKETVDKYLSRIDHVINDLKRHIYSDELFELDEKFGDYKSGYLDFRDYIEFISSKAASHNIDLSSAKNMVRLLESIKLEDNINFVRANEERDSLVKVLGRMLSKKDKEELLKRTRDLQSGRISEGEYYRYISGKAGLMGLDLKPYPDLDVYIKYILSYHDVDRSMVMEELTSLEDAIKEEFYTSEDQRRLNDVSRIMVLTKNLFSVSLTKEDYKYYIGNKSDFELRPILSFISERAGRHKVVCDIDEGVYDLDVYREEMEEFFEYSFERDDAFIRNLKFSNIPGGEEGAIMVSGGFHSENLCELFKQNRISYISIMPNFTSPQGYRCEYFSLLAGGLSPDEKIISDFLSSSAIAIASFLSPLGGLSEGKEKELFFEINVALEKAMAAGRDLLVKDGDRRLVLSHDKRVMAEDELRPGSFDVVDITGSIELMPAAKEGSRPEGIEVERKEIILSTMMNITKSMLIMTAVTLVGICFHELAIPMIIGTMLGGAFLAVSMRKSLKEADIDEEDAPMPVIQSIAEFAGEKGVDPERDPEAYKDMVRAVVKIWGDRTGMDISDNWFNQMMLPGALENNMFVAMDDNNAVQGFVFYGIASDGRLILSRIAVSEEAEDRGIGTALMDRVMDMAYETGIEEFEMSALKDAIPKYVRYFNNNRGRFFMTNPNAVRDGYFTGSVRGLSRSGKEKRAREILSEIRPDLSGRERLMPMEWKAHVTRIVAERQPAAKGRDPIEFHRYIVLKGVMDGVYDLFLALKFRDFSRALKIFTRILLACPLPCFKKGQPGEMHIYVFERSTFGFMAGVASIGVWIALEFYGPGVLSSFVIWKGTIRALILGYIAVTGIFNFFARTPDGSDLEHELMHAYIWSIIDRFAEEGIIDGPHEYNSDRLGDDEGLARSIFEIMDEGASVGRLDFVEENIIKNLILSEPPEITPEEKDTMEHEQRERNQRMGRGRVLTVDPPGGVSVRSSSELNEQQDIDTEEITRQIAGIWSRATGKYAAKALEECRGIIGDAGRTVLLTTDGTGRIIGFAVLKRAKGRDLFSMSEGAITHFAIHPDARGHDIGQAMFDKAVEIIKESGASECSLTFIKDVKPGFADVRLYDNGGNIYFSSESKISIWWTDEERKTWREKRKARQRAREEALRIEAIKKAAATVRYSREVDPSTVTVKDLEERLEVLKGNVQARLEFTAWFMVNYDGNRSLRRWAYEKLFRIFKDEVLAIRDREEKVSMIAEFLDTMRDDFRKGYEEGAFGGRYLNKYNGRYGPYMELESFLDSLAGEALDFDSARSTAESLADKLSIGQMFEEVYRGLSLSELKLIAEHGIMVNRTNFATIASKDDPYQGKRSKESRDGGREVLVRMMVPRWLLSFDDYGFGMVHFGNELDMVSGDYLKSVRSIKSSLEDELRKGTSGSEELQQIREQDARKSIDALENVLQLIDPAKRAERRARGRSDIDIGVIEAGYIQWEWTDPETGEKKTLMDVNRLERFKGDEERFEQDVKPVLQKLYDDQLFWSDIVKDLEETGPADNTDQVQKRGKSVVGKARAILEGMRPDLSAGVGLSREAFISFLERISTEAGLADTVNSLDPGASTYLARIYLLNAAQRFSLEGLPDINELISKVLFSERLFDDFGIDGVDESDLSGLEEELIRELARFEVTGASRIKGDEISQEEMEEYIDEDERATGIDIGDKDEAPFQISREADFDDTLSNAARKFIEDNKGREFNDDKLRELLVALSMEREEDPELDGNEVLARLYEKQVIKGPDILLVKKYLKDGFETPPPQDAIREVFEEYGLDFNDAQEIRKALKLEGLTYAEMWDKNIERLREVFYYILMNQKYEKVPFLLQGNLYAGLEEEATDDVIKEAFKRYNLGYDDRANIERKLIKAGMDEKKIKSKSIEDLRYVMFLKIRGAEELKNAGLDKVTNERTGKSLRVKLKTFYGGNRIAYLPMKITVVRTSSGQKHVLWGHLSSEELSRLRPDLAGSQVDYGNGLQFKGTGSYFYSGHWVQKYFDFDEPGSFAGKYIRRKGLTDQEMSLAEQLDKYADNIAKGYAQSNKELYDWVRDMSKDKGVSGTNYIGDYCKVTKTKGKNEFVINVGDKKTTVKIGKKDPEKIADELCRKTAGQYISNVLENLEKTQKEKLTNRVRIPLEGVFDRYGKEQRVDITYFDNGAAGRTYSLSERMVVDELVGQPGMFLGGVYQSGAAEYIGITQKYDERTAYIQQEQVLSEGAHLGSEIIDISSNGLYGDKGIDLTQVIRVRLGSVDRMHPVDNLKVALNLGKESEKIKEIKEHIKALKEEAKGDLKQLFKNVGHNTDAFMRAGIVFTDEYMFEGKDIGTGGRGNDLSEFGDINSMSPEEQEQYRMLHIAKWLRFLSVLHLGSENSGLFEKDNILLESYLKGIFGEENDDIVRRTMQYLTTYASEKRLMKNSILSQAEEVLKENNTDKEARDVMKKIRSEMAGKEPIEVIRKNFSGDEDAYRSMEEIARIEATSDLINTDKTGTIRKVSAYIYERWLESVARKAGAQVSIKKKLDNEIYLVDTPEGERLMFTGNTALSGEVISDRAEFLRLIEGKAAEDAGVYDAGNVGKLRLVDLVAEPVPLRAVKAHDLAGAKGPIAGFGIRMTGERYAAEEKVEQRRDALRARLDKGIVPDGFTRQEVLVEGNVVELVVNEAMSLRLEEKGVTMQAFIEECIRIRGPDTEDALASGLYGKTLIIDVLDSSPNLYGNSIQDGYIYVNRTAPGEMDAIGVSHELMHEAGILTDSDIDEAKLAEADIALMNQRGIAPYNLKEDIGSVEYTAVFEQSLLPGVETGLDERLVSAVKSIYRMRSGWANPVAAFEEFPLWEFFLLRIDIVSEPEGSVSEIGGLPFIEAGAHVEELHPREDGVPYIHVDRESSTALIYAHGQSSIDGKWCIFPEVDGRTRAIPLSFYLKALAGRGVREVYVTSCNPFNAGLVIPAGMEVHYPVTTVFNTHGIIKKALWKTLKAPEKEELVAAEDTPEREGDRFSKAIRSIKKFLRKHTFSVFASGQQDPDYPVSRMPLAPPADIQQSDRDKMLTKAPGSQTKEGKAETEEQKTSLSDLEQYLKDQGLDPESADDRLSLAVKLENMWLDVNRADGAEERDERSVTDSAFFQNTFMPMVESGQVILSQDANGKINGYIAYDISEKQGEPKIIHIHRVVVAEESRGKGSPYRKLMDAAFEKGLAEGANQFFLFSLLNSMESHEKYFDSRGKRFFLTSTGRTFQGEIMDESRMGEEDYMPERVRIINADEVLGQGEKAVEKTALAMNAIAGDAEGVSFREKYGMDAREMLESKEYNYRLTLVSDRRKGVIGFAVRGFNDGSGNLEVNLPESARGYGIDKAVKKNMEERSLSPDADMAGIGLEIEELMPLADEPEEEPVVQRPIVDASPDPEKVREWIDAHSPELRDMARALAENITYVTQSELEEALEKSLAALNEKLDGPFGVFINGAEFKSNSWMFRIAAEKGLREPEAGTMHSKNIEDWMLENPGIEDIVIIDDGSYSGTQLEGQIRMIRNRMMVADRKVRIHVVVPYMTNAAVRKIMAQRDEVTDVELYSPNIIESVSEIFDRLTAKDPGYYGPIFEQVKKVYIGADSAETALTYFQSKKPDIYSTLGVWVKKGADGKQVMDSATVLEGVVADEQKGWDRQVAFIPGVIEPYKEGYLEKVEETFTGSDWEPRVASKEGVSKVADTAESRQEALAASAAGVGRKGDIVKVVVGVPEGFDITSANMATINNMLNDIFEGNKYGCTKVNGVGEAQKFDSKQIVLYHISEDTAQTERNYNRAMNTAEKSLAGDLSRAPGDVKGNIIAFAKNGAEGTAYRTGDTIKVIRDAYADSDFTGSRFPDVLARFVLARHVAYYFNSEDKDMTKINALLSQLVEGYDGKTMSDLLNGVLEIKPIDYQEGVEEWEAYLETAVSL